MAFAAATGRSCPGVRASKAGPQPRRRGPDVLMVEGGGHGRGQEPELVVDGRLDVRFVTGPDGKRSVIVDITGTKSWIPRNGDITNLDTNLLSAVLTTTELNG